MVSLSLNRSVMKEKLKVVYQNDYANQSANLKNGQKGAIVELFEWLYQDIKQECEFLSKAGYIGVKIFTPQESVISN